MMLLYLVTFGIAKGLCKLWDNRTQNKNIEFDDEATVYGNFDNYVSHTNSSHKSNKKTIVIIAVIVILVLAVLIICFSMFNDKESTEFEKTQLDVVTDTSSNEKNDSEDNINVNSNFMINNESVPKPVPENNYDIESSGTIKQPYTKGTLSTTSYKNNYLDILFVLPDWWEMYTEEEMTKEYGEYSDVFGGFEMIAYNALSYESISVLVERTPYLSDVTLGTYMTSALSSLPETQKIISTDKKRMIGGYEYTVVESSTYIADADIDVKMDMYFRKVGEVFLVLSATYFGDNTNIENALNTFQSINQDIFEKELADNEYVLADLPGTIMVDDKYNVYSLENEITEDMCLAQDTSYEQVISYLELNKSFGGIEMVILPVSEPIGRADFEIQIKVKTKDYGVSNLKDVNEKEFNEFAEWLMQEFSSAECDGYEIYETPNAKFIAFDCKMTKYQKRYATVINGKMVYFIASSPNLKISEEQNNDIKNMVDSLKY